MTVYEQARKAIAYLTALCDAHDAVESGKAIDTAKPESAPVDTTAQKTTAQNIALAGSGDKAALMGTISTEPTITSKELVDAGIDEKLAVEIITERDAIRADALALTEVKP